MAAVDSTIWSLSPDVYGDPELREYVISKLRPLDAATFAPLSTLVLVGGLGGDKTSSSLIFEASSRLGSFAVSYGAHVGIYVGDGKFVSATSSGGVQVRSLYDSYWGPRWVGGTRTPVTK